VIYSAAAAAVVPDQRHGAARHRTGRRVLLKVRVHVLPAASMRLTT